MQGYDEFMLIEDIRTVLNSDDNYRIKIACIESYFNVYEKFLSIKENQVQNARYN